MDQKKKKPVNYPQFYFRVSEENKKVIDELIDQILKSKLKSHDEESKLPKRNAIIVEALILGLDSYKKKTLKKS